MLEESIRAYMAARGSVFEARVFDCVDSTNTVLAALARSGAPEFTAVIAGAQIAGRGRGEHRFFSPAGTPPCSPCWGWGSPMGSPAGSWKARSSEMRTQILALGALWYKARC